MNLFTYSIPHELFSFVILSKDLFEGDLLKRLSKKPKMFFSIQPQT